MNNPNILYGHEGSLLKVINTSTGKLNGSWDIDDLFYNKTLGTRLSVGDVVVYLKSSDKDETDYKDKFISVLKGQEIFKIKIDPRNWMYYFTPYPRGGFVPTDAETIERLSKSQSNR